MERKKKLDLIFRIFRFLFSIVTEKKNVPVLVQAARQIKDNILKQHPTFTRGDEGVIVLSRGAPVPLQTN